MQRLDETFCPENLHTHTVKLKFLIKHKDKSVAGRAADSKMPHLPHWFQRLKSQARLSPDQPDFTWNKKLLGTLFQNQTTLNDCDIEFFFPLLRIYGGRQNHLTFCIDLAQLTLVVSLKLFGWKMWFLCECYGITCQSHYLSIVIVRRCERRWSSLGTLSAAFKL